MEHRIRPDGANDVVALLLELLHRRDDLVDLLPAEQPVLPAVGVETTGKASAVSLIEAVRLAVKYAPSFMR